jgi:hypothetical protein
MHIPMCYHTSLSLRFQLRHAFKGYDPDRAPSNTGGIADEQKMRTAGLAERESSVCAPV